MSTVSPQGYQIENNPVNNNPFWEYEIEGSGLKSIECTKTTQGDFDYYAWSYTDADDISHHVMTQAVSTKAGTDGVTFTPSVSSEGVISWTNDGGLPNPSPVSIRGPQGIQGIQGIQGPAGPAGPAGATGARGPQGVPGEPGQDGADGLDGTSPSIEVTEITGGYQLTIIDAYGTHNVNILNGTDGTPGTAATVSVGTVTTGQPGSSATVVNSGTPNAAVLDFSIPQGATGATGPAGPQGPRGETGETGPQGPQGETGPAGPQGPAGQDGLGTVTVGTTTTGAAGTQASVVNSGTPQNAILDFTIPQGAQGETGATGPQGPQGIQGETGPQGPQGETGATGATGPQGPAGQGVPTGGTAGQVLAKVDGTDYNTEWVTPSGGGVSLREYTYTVSSSLTYADIIAAALYNWYQLNGHHSTTDRAMMSTMTLVLTIGTQAYHFKATKINFPAGRSNGEISFAASVYNSDSKVDTKIINAAWGKNYGQFSSVKLIQMLSGSTTTFTDMSSNTISSGFANIYWVA